MPSTTTSAAADDGEGGGGSSSSSSTSNTAHQQPQQEANNGTRDASSQLAPAAVAAPNESEPSAPAAGTDLDAPYFYYHNDRTGQVATTALMPRQLIPLLSAGILSGSTRIVPITMTTSTTGETTYGDWTTCDQIDLLQHAACPNWYYTSSEKKETQGPVTVKQLSTIQNSIHMVYAPTVCDEWKAYADYSTLRQVVSVFEQQQQQQALPLPTTTKTAKTKATADDKDDFEDFLDDDDDESNTDEHADDEEWYQSDGGTTYVKDQSTGNWVMEALYRANHPASTQQESTKTTKKDSNQPPPSKKRKKDTSSNEQPKFKKKHAKHWIYVTGLPKSVDKDQVVQYFQKVGLIDLDPLTLQPKVKLYLNENGVPKGDASICYAKKESVALALQILDDSVWDEHHTIQVQKAEFSASTNSSGNPKKRTTKPAVSTAQRKVAKLALKQAQDDGFGGRLEGGRKGLTIVICQNMVTEHQMDDNELEAHLRNQAEAFGPVEKITYIASSNTVIYKFVEPTAASAAIRAWHHRTVPTAGSDDNGKKQKMEAFYWDGVTDYTSTTSTKDEAQEEAQRHEEFGKWLEAQGGEDELPPELRLQVEK